MDRDYYEVLGVQKGSSLDEVKKAYHRQALRHHPDKNKAPGAEAKFKSVAEAYDVLSDPKKKDVYDRFGKEGLRADGAGGPEGFHVDPHALFQQLFGGRSPFSGGGGGGFQFTHGGVGGGSPMFGGRGGGGGGARMGGGGAFGGGPLPPGMMGGGGAGPPRHKDPPVVHELAVTLEEVFSGCTKRMKITRRRLAADRRSWRSEDKILEVTIRRGWKAGTRITFRSEGDQPVDPHGAPADVVFVVKDAPHAVFRRDGQDIVYAARLSLRQALGCDALGDGGVVTVSAPTLDGRTVSVTAAGPTGPTAGGGGTDDVIVRPGTRRRVAGEGLPLPKSPGRRGDLVVEFQVDFPERLSESAKEAISQALPPC